MPIAFKECQWCSEELRGAFLEGTNQTCPTCASLLTAVQVDLPIVSKMVKALEMAETLSLADQLIKDKQV